MKVQRLSAGNYDFGSWRIHYNPDLMGRWKWVAYDSGNPLAADTFPTLKAAVASIRATVRS